MRAPGKLAGPLVEPAVCQLARPPAAAAGQRSPGAGQGVGLQGLMGRRSRSVSRSAAARVSTK